MLGTTRISTTIQTGQRCLCTHHPVLFQRTNWPKRGSLAFIQLWINPTSLIGPYVQSEHLDFSQNRELLFVSIKKGFDKDISPPTISSWIKQPVILCYELCDQKTLTLHLVNEHEVRAFASSKDFQLGVSLENKSSQSATGSHLTPSNRSF